MSTFLWLVPIALLMGLGGLAAFLWSMRNGQYEDLDGAAERIFIDAQSDRPLGTAEENDRSETASDAESSSTRTPMNWIRWRTSR